MGIGAALQQIGGGLMSWGMQRNDQKGQQAAAEQARQRDLEDWKARQAFLQRMQVPEERQAQVYNEQLKKAQLVKREWQVGADGVGTWAETGRQDVPAPPGKTETFRQGDEDVTALINPQTGEVIKELGRGSAYAPSQRSGGGGMGGGSAPRGKAPTGYRFTQDGDLEAIPGGPADKPAVGEDAIKLNSGDRKNIATTRQKLGTLDAIENQLSNVEALFEPLKGSWSAGGAGQGRLPTEEGRKFDAAVAQLSPLMRQLTRVPGEGAVSDYETQLLERAALNRGDYESTTEEKLKAARELVNEMRKAHAMSLETYGLGPDGKPIGEAKEAGPAAKAPASGGYRVGDVITEGGKRYRVVGGTPDDPEVEPL